MVLEYEKTIKPPYACELCCFKGLNLLRLIGLERLATSLDFSFSLSLLLDFFCVGPLCGRIKGPHLKLGWSGVSMDDDY